MLTGVQRTSTCPLRRALAFGASADRYRDALATGTALATARYAHGELVTHDHITSVAGATREPAAVAFVERIEQIAGERVAVVAVPTLEVPDPTTVGLGDTFVGGFLAACARLVDAPIDSLSVPHPATTVAAGKAP